MKKYEEEKREIMGYGYPEKTLQLLTSLVSLDNYPAHMKARDKLVKQGESILPVMHKLIESPSDIIRREAAKILKIIAHRSSIPVAIKLLEDRESENRWIAAEILIATGRSSIKPLLRELIENGASSFLRHGAHHVLSELVAADDPEELKEFLNESLIGNELPDVIPVKAANILHKKLI
jgi:HEAT repeat protein